MVIKDVKFFLIFYNDCDIISTDPDDHSLPWAGPGTTEPNVIFNSVESGVNG